MVRQQDPWYDHKGFFEHKLAEPNIYDQGKVKSETEALRMPNLHLTKDQVLDLTTFLMGSQETSLPASYQYKPGDARHDIQEGWWVVKKYNCMGCHQFIPGQQTILMGLKQYQDAQEQLPPKLLTEGARVDPEWLRKFLSNPALSTTDTNRNGVRPYLKVRMPTFSFSDNELRKLVRFFQALSQQPLPYIPEQVPVLTREGNRHGAQPVLQHGRALPEVPRHGRSSARQDRDSAELPAGERTPEAGLGGALDHRPASGQPGHIHALGPVQAAEQSVGVRRADAAVVPGLHRRSSQAADGLHLPVNAGRTAEGGGIHAARESGSRAGRAIASRRPWNRISSERRFAVEWRVRWRLAIGLSP